MKNEDVQEGPVTEAELQEAELLLWGGDSESLSETEAHLLYTVLPRLIAEVRRLQGQAAGAATE